MPNFTDLDPSLVASFWIYFVGSFIGGAVAGTFFSRLFFRREKNIIEQERKNYEEEKKKFEKIEKILADKNEELERLKAEVSNNELYWNAKQYEKQKAPGDKVLYELVHKTNEKKK